MTCSLVIPAGSWRPITPLKMTSVALPRIFGPTTEATTATVPMATTTANNIRSGRSMPISRRSEGPKLIAFSATFCAIGP